MMRTSGGFAPAILMRRSCRHSFTRNSGWGNYIGGKTMRAVPPQQRSHAVESEAQRHAPSPSAGSCSGICQTNTRMVRMIGFVCVCERESRPGRGACTTPHQSLRLRRTPEREQASAEGTTPEIKVAIKCQTSSKFPFPPGFARITMSANITLRGYKTPGRYCLHARCTVVLAFH